MRAAFEEWRPDVVVRDPNEYASALAAEEHGIPHARVAIGLSSTEELGLGVARRPSTRSAGQGLAPDPARPAARLALPHALPASLDEGEQPDTHRFHDPAWDERRPSCPDWWPGRGASRSCT